MNSQELIKILEAKLQSKPTDNSIKEKLADLLISQADLSKAEALLKEIIQDAPLNSTALWGLARIAFSREDHESVYGYLTSLSTIPDYQLDKDQALLFAKACYQLELPDEAFVWFDFSAKLDSSLLEREIYFLRQLRLLADKKEKEQQQNNSSTGSKKPVGLADNKNYIVIEISSAILGGGSQSSPSQSPKGGPAQEASKDSMSLPENLVPAEMVSPVVTFEQIVGYNFTKRELLQNLALPLCQHKKSVEYKKGTNPKVLLYGPPGCGKTLHCLALMNEANISLFPLSVSDFADLSYEASEMKLEYIMAQARYHKPAAIVIDDASWLLCNSDSSVAEQGSYSFRKNIFERIVKLLDTKFKFNSQLGLIAVTSNPWDISPDILTACQFNKTIFMPPPTFNEKVKILDTILESKKSPILNPSDVDSLQVMRALDKWYVAPSDLELLVDNAISEVMIDEIIGSHYPQSSDNISTDKISTKSIIHTGKLSKNISGVTDWMDMARSTLKKQAPFNRLWKQIEFTLKNRYE